MFKSITAALKNLKQFNACLKAIFINLIAKKTIAVYFLTITFILVFINILLFFLNAITKFNNIKVIIFIIKMLLLFNELYVFFLTFN